MNLTAIIELDSNHFLPDMSTAHHRHRGNVDFLCCVRFPELRYAQHACVVLITRLRVIGVLLGE